MRPDKQLALKLRLSGKSYSQINKSLGIPKATLSDWLSNVQLSDHAREKIITRGRSKSIDALIKRNKAQTSLAVKRKITIQNAAAAQINKLSRENLLLIGAALYLAEGYKRPIKEHGRERTYHPVSFTNSDSHTIKIFLRFLREVCEVPENKLRADLRIYRHINQKVAKQYWQDVTKIGPERFRKIYTGISKSSLGKRPYNRLPYGTIQIRVDNTKLFHTIMGWIEGIKKFA